MEDKFNEAIKSDSLFPNSEKILDTILDQDNFERTHALLNKIQNLTNEQFEGLDNLKNKMEENKKITQTKIWDKVTNGLGRFAGRRVGVEIENPINTYTNVNEVIDFFEKYKGKNLEEARKIKIELHDIFKPENANEADFSVFELFKKESVKKGSPLTFEEKIDIFTKNKINLTSYEDFSNTLNKLRRYREGKENLKIIAKLGKQLYSAVDKYKLARNIALGSLSTLTGIYLFWSKGKEDDLNKELRDQIAENERLKKELEDSKNP